MRTIEQTIYTFDELPTIEARDKARDWYRGTMEFSWCDESKQSIDAFCSHFGVSLREWSIGPYEPISYDVQFFNSHFRGIKLKDIDRDAMPTGYCLDCSLWWAFYDQFKITGCAKKAFEAALDEGFKQWRADLESQLEDEFIDECLVINGYEFTEDGERF
jgi:hypothetical protein